MGFADYAISILKSNKKLLKRTSFKNGQAQVNDSSVGRKAKRRLAKDALERVRENQRVDSMKQLILLMIVIALSCGIIKYLFL